jgi:hypothetical protein
MNYNELSNRQHWVVLHYRAELFTSQEYRGSLPSEVLTDLLVLLSTLEGMEITASDSCRQMLESLDKKLQLLTGTDEASKAVSAQIDADFLLDQLKEAARGLEMIRREPGFANRPDLIKDFEDTLAKTIEDYRRGQRSSFNLMMRLKDGYERILMAANDPIVRRFKDQKRERPNSK